MVRLIQHYPLLQRYREQLKALREAWRHSRQLPDAPFFLFGMGARQKMIYQAGKLIDGHSGTILREWQVAEETIAPPAYRVVLGTQQEELIEINEDERGVWLVENGQASLLSESPLKLPSFEGQPYNLVLRVLHHEILVNILDGKPLPNYLVYPRPWYRDAAMLAMVLKRTGNLDLIKDWILSLDDPFDHNNAGETESDNLGQALYLISLVSDRSHPLVARILDLLPGFTQENVLRGRTDFNEHPVYQTQWLKTGLAALGLTDSYQVPGLDDSYASLAWWAGGSAENVSQNGASLDYPYLSWAEDHFFNRRNGPVGSLDYPLTWEGNASQAQYSGMSLISPDYVTQNLAAPHTWHAAEMFLTLSDLGQSAG